MASLTAAAHRLCWTCPLSRLLYVASLLCWRSASQLCFSWAAGRGGGVASRPAPRRNRLVGAALLGQAGRRAREGEEAATAARACPLRCHAERRRHGRAHVLSFSASVCGSIFAASCASSRLCFVGWS